MLITKRIVLYGRGTLAKAIEAAAKKREHVHVARFSADDGDFREKKIELFGKSRLRPLTDGIGIYAAKSGDRLPDFINLCVEKRIPMIQASTGHELPKAIGCPIIVVPNLAIPIMLFLVGLEKFVEPMIAAGLRRHVTELHQESKDSVPGTAEAMARAVRVPPNKIVSIRDPNIALALGVPYQSLGRHGHHVVSIHGFCASLELKTKVNGAEAYGEGAMYLTSQILDRRPLSNKIYGPEDFLFA